jgi:hypothetical protein
MRNGRAGIRGRPPGRAAPGSGPAHGAPASASAARTMIRLARGGAMAPRWPPAKGWRRTEGWRRAEGWRGWNSRGRRCRGWRPMEIAVPVGTIPREAPRRARHCHQRLTRLWHACLVQAPGLAGPGLAYPRLAHPGNRRSEAGGAPEPSGLEVWTRGAPDFPNHPSGTGLYAVALPPARNHDHDSHSTGHFLYSSQTPVRAHFWPNAVVCRSSHFLVHTGWPAV